MVGAPMADTAAPMKRFYKKAAVRPAEGQFEILLDDRPVKTPARNALRVPTEGQGRAISEEWNAQGEGTNTRSMDLAGSSKGGTDWNDPKPAESTPGR